MFFFFATALCVFLHLHLGRSRDCLLACLLACACGFGEDSRGLCFGIFEKIETLLARGCCEVVVVAISSWLLVAAVFA